MSKFLKIRDLEPEMDYQKEVGNFIDSLFNLSSFAETFKEQKGFNLDLSESGSGYFIESELPGIEKEDIKIEMKEGNLVLSAERRYEEEKRDRKYYRRERSYGKFSRSIPLPEDAVTDNIEAEFKNGVLKITVPKKERVVENGRRIEIK